MSLIDEFDDTTGRLLIKGFLFLIDIAVFSLIVMILWDYLAPVLGLVKLSYQDSVAVFLLSRFLLKDHLLSSEAIVVHCPHHGNDENKEDEKETQQTTED